MPQPVARMFLPGVAERVERFRSLLARLRPVPVEWLEGPVATPRGEPGISPLACTDWATVCRAWARALRWRKELEDVLAVLLAVSMSTMQVGDQLFLQLCAHAGSAKTRFADALLVSRTCYPMEHLNGFHSGYVDASGDDFSLIARSNGKTWITPEGDVLVSSPCFPELMSQIRRIFDGTSGASYKNKKEDRRYTGLRTPWIMAGTPAMLAATDQSRLGDRFLRVYIDDPDEDERRAILRRAAYTGLAATLQTSNGAVATTLTPEMCHAYRVTGGYVDHLRASAPDLLAQVQAGSGAGEVSDQVDVYADLAEFTADLRARPAPDVRGQASECPDGKELPARLVQQYGRLALCLAAVLQRRGVDQSVLDLVAKVARDTSRGRTLTMVERVLRAGNDGIEATDLALRLGDPKGLDTARLLKFLANLGVVEHFDPRTVVGIRTRARWRVTDRSVRLYTRATGK